MLYLGRPVRSSLNLSLTPKGMRANGNLTVKMPFARMPFGVSDKFKDERTGRPKYSISFGLYNPDAQEELDAFCEWLEGTYRTVVIDLIVDSASKWEMKNLKGEAGSQAFLIYRTLA